MNKFKALLSVLSLFLVSVPLASQAYQSEAELKCSDLAGFSLVVNDLKAQGIGRIELVARLEDYAKSNPQFPGNAYLNDALAVVDLVYTNRSFSPNEISETVYKVCMAATPNM